MGLRHVYVQNILNITMVVVLQVSFHYETIYEMGPPRLGKQIKELRPLSSSRQGQGHDRFRMRRGSLK